LYFFILLITFIVWFLTASSSLSGFPILQAVHIRD
jgi:hypothetical protein